METEKRIKYTLGIVFDKKLKNIILILKNRPKWQAGKYNFPGGHVEKKETFAECISREFKEECGILINKSEWKLIGFIKNLNNYIVGLLTSIYKSETHGLLKTIEDQNVISVKINNLPENIMSNVIWLIQFAINIWKQGNIDDLIFGTFYYKYKQ